MVRKLNPNLEITTDEVPAWAGRHRLETMVGELERQLNARQDVVANGQRMVVRVDEGRPRLQFDNHETMPISDGAFTQLCNRLTPSVPMAFVRDLMKEHPARAEDLLTGVLREDKAPHLVRVLDNRVRAFLSDRYKCLDHYDVAMAALKVVREKNGVLIQSSLTDSHMRLKFTTAEVTERLADEAIKHGDHHFVQFGQAGNTALAPVRDLPPNMPMPHGAHTMYPTVTVSNSEIGKGMFVVQIGVLLSYCTNLCVMDTVAEEIHVGGRIPEGILRRETIEVRSKATVMESVDAIGSAFDVKRFADVAHGINRAFQAEIPDAPKAVDATMKLLGSAVRKEDRDSLLGYFVRDYSQTRGGLAQAVSRLAQDATDPDREQALEEAAGILLRNP
jgi:hypothetical protein